MSLIDRLESRLGRFAIPGLLQAIAILQLVTLLIFMVLPQDARQPYQAFLMFDGDRILAGEVWRLVSYVFIPSYQLFFAVIGTMFMMWLGRGLDEAWGAFKVNVYVFWSLLAVAIGGLALGLPVSAAWLYFSVLFAFATFYPNEEIYLFFILPVKIKWIAFFAAGSLVLTFVSAPAYIIPALLALSGYFIAFGPQFIKGQIHSAKVANRREKFAREADTGAAYFHKCSKCGKTDVDDPSLHFRVSDSGEEICSSCRKLG